MSFVDAAKKHCYDCNDMQAKKLNWIERFGRFLSREIRWLIPGIGIKRWVLVVLFGTSLLGIGFAVLVLDVYRTAPETWWLPILSFLSLRFLDRTLRAIIFGGIGVALVIWGLAGLNRALLKPFVKPGQTVVETISSYRKREKGPHIVALGGGNGLSTLLRGLKHLTSNLTAIVTVADDGGSSGEIRKSTGFLPPGDIRNCLAALSDDEALLSQIFQYRFGATMGLNGHTLGNLFITGLTEITGSFEEAVAESGRVLAVRGRVLPSTLKDVRLAADISFPKSKSSIQVKGESQIPKVEGKIQRVWLEPNDPGAYPPSVQAILSADLIIIGPGSLYTSILPDLLVPDILKAIKASRALKFYICNVATQPGETDGYTCGDHIEAIEKHLGHNLIDLMVCNNRFEGELSTGVDWVKPEIDLDQKYAIYQTDLLDVENPWRHDPTKLANTINDLYLEKTGPLTLKDEVQSPETNP